MYMYSKEIKKFIGKSLSYDTWGGGYLWGELPNNQGQEMIAQVEDVDEKPEVYEYTDEKIDKRALSFIENNINNLNLTSMADALFQGYVQGFNDCLKEKDNPVISVRGWGAIQHLFKTYEECKHFQDELGKFIADAVNEKLKTL